MSAPYLEIKGLKKTYNLRPILRDIDMVLDQGKCMALLGANGAGKTTLLRILACLTKPEAGTVRIGGLDIGQEAQQIRLLVGFVGHQPNLYDELTVIENLLFFGRMYSVKKARERAAALLQRVGLARRSNERVATLSRGQLQRLSLARALLHSPQLLLLDEPDAGRREGDLGEYNAVRYCAEPSAAGCWRSASIRDACLSASGVPAGAASARRNCTGGSGCRAGARGCLPRRRGRRSVNRAARRGRCRRPRRPSPGSGSSRCRPCHS